MATWREWMAAVGVSAEPCRTSKAYAQIRDLGLETVRWLEFDSLQGHRRAVYDFIDRNAPCLFIFDPKDNAHKKGYLFGVEDWRDVRSWLKENEANLNAYQYLVTTQITNPGNGFVGTMYSDGEGRMFCETMHAPGVCNHRALSQNAPSMDLLDHFIVNSWELDKAPHRLGLPRVKLLADMFGDKKGYFEFVKGEHCGQQGIYTTGYEPLSHNLQIPSYTFEGLRERRARMAGAVRTWSGKVDAKLP